jgi:AbiV family abortive infection protein
MAACRSNALELIGESGLLSSSGHFARAYALLHTACEELAKFSILELGGRRLAQGNPPLWKRFWQRFRSHDSKTAQLQLLYLMVESVDVVDPHLGKAAEALFNCGLSIRNSALYVDVGPDGKFRKPSDIDFRIPLPVLRAAAKLALDAADRRGHSLHDIELSLRESPNRSAKENALVVLAEITRRLKDAGLEKDAAAEMLKRAFGQ